MTELIPRRVDIGCFIEPLNRGNVIMIIGANRMISPKVITPLMISVLPKASTNPTSITRIHKAPEIRPLMIAFFQMEDVSVFINDSSCFGSTQPLTQ
jgi:hypothetical protein